MVHCERGYRGMSTKYRGQGLGRGCPSFNGRHNKAKFLALLMLANIELHYRRHYPKGIPTQELSRVSGVKASTLFRKLSWWHRWGFVNRTRRPIGFLTRQGYRVGFGSAQCFYYTIGARGKRWVSEYQELVPPEWYAHLQRKS